MADSYLAALLQQQPQGPYRLVGWSLGGSLALELAARLEARGEEVAFLGLLDCYVPGTEIAGDDARHPQARAKLVEHLQLLAPELPAKAWDGLLERLLQLEPLDWPQVASIQGQAHLDRKSTRLNSSHVKISYAVFCLKKK